MEITEGLQKRCALLKEVHDYGADSAYKLTKKYGKSLKDLTSDTKTFYGLENPFEFISEAMVNPNFRNELRSVSNNNYFENLRLGIFYGAYSRLRTPETMKKEG